MVSQCIYIYSKGKFEGQRCLNLIAPNSQHFCKQHMKLVRSTKHKSISATFNRANTSTKTKNNFSLTLKKQLSRRTKSFPSKLQHSKTFQKPLKNSRVLTLAANVIGNQMLMSKLSQLNKTGRNYVGSQLASRRALNMVDYYPQMSRVNRSQRQSEKNKIMTTLRFLLQIALMTKSQFKPIRNKWSKEYAGYYQTAERQKELFGELPQFIHVLDNFPSAGTHFNYLQSERKKNDNLRSRQFLAIKYLYYGFQQHRKRPTNQLGNIHVIRTYYYEPTIQELFYSAEAFSRRTGFNERSVDTYINLVNKSLEGNDEALWDLYNFFMNKKLFPKRMMYNPNMWKSYGYRRPGGNNYSSSGENYNLENYVANRVFQIGPHLTYISNKINGDIIK